MRILHVLSNYKWTERAEPAADLAVGQQRLGHEVGFVCGRNRDLKQEDTVDFRLRQKGLTPDVLNMTKHFGIKTALTDVRALRRLIIERRIQVVHAHMPNAHLISALAARLAQPRPLVVRSIYHPDKDEQPLRLKLSSRIGTDGIVAITTEAQSWLKRAVGLPEARIRIIEPSVDLDRFQPGRHSDLRTEFALQPEDFVLGMVTAIGPRRRLDLVWGAVRLLADRHPRLRVFLVGRGKIERVVEEPARKLGIRDRIVLAGYCRDDRLVQAYRTMNALVYPMPGTDKSCRTVREAMAAGVPVLASRVGFLPSLVEHRKTGWLTEVSSESLAAAIEECINDPTRLSNMGAEALAVARKRFSPMEQAEATMAFYDDLSRSSSSR
jgi:glycosyltransferase involved in cell wall biosynthesis